MTKKTIILVLIILLVINTIFWLYMGISTYSCVSAAGGKYYKYLDEPKIRDSFGGSMIITFKDAYPHASFIILAITDAVLIAIYFMTIPLYKKEGKKLKKLEN
ncbi:unnamed protein product [marine sediment metagenome]|uniref:Uncharacterized protein n=1 Tax=marine sediment metagenome TaxID=412755 RepID=X0ZM47_9ZZZZ